MYPDLNTICSIPPRLCLAATSRKPYNLSRAQRAFKSMFQLKCCQEGAFSVPSTTALALGFQQGRAEARCRASRGAAGMQVVQTPSARGCGGSRKYPAWIQTALKFTLENQNLVRHCLQGTFTRHVEVKVHSTLFSAAVVEAKCKCYIRCGRSECSSVTSPQQWICKAESSDA